MNHLDKLLEAVDELTRPRRHREGLTPDMAPLDARTRKPIHGAVIQHVASLLEQLEDCPPANTLVLDNGHPVPDSRPNANIESLDALAAVERESRWLLTYLGGTGRDTAADNLRGLVGMFDQLLIEQQRDLAQIAQRWASRAKSVTGWEDPPFSPNNTCPLCAASRTLRIRVISISDAHASCVACGETWTPDTIGLLAEHIRAENSDYEDMEASA